MPVPSSEQFVAILKNAKKEKYALPAINVSSIETANAALLGFKEANSDGIIQFSLGAGKFASGPAEDPVLGVLSIAEHIHRVAERLGVFVALHTDHCQLEELDFVKELVAISAKRKREGRPILFNGHMFDGSDLSLEKNIAVAQELLASCREVGIVPEFEAGVVGGEEEGAATTNDITKLYTTPEDMLYVANQLYEFDAPFMFAATFGNVHGIYKPGNVVLKPEILRDGQAAVGKKYGSDRELFLVFHGGSGTPTETIRETLNYGVIKMNVDTATQYAFTRPIVDHMLVNYQGVLMVDGEMGNKKLYDPRSYLKKASKAMSARVVEACNDLCSNGKTISK